MAWLNQEKNQINLSASWIKRRINLRAGWTKKSISLKAGWIRKRIKFRSDWIRKRINLRAGWIKKRINLKVGCIRKRINLRVGWITEEHHGLAGSWRGTTWVLVGSGGPTLVSNASEWWSTSRANLKEVKFQRCLDEENYQICWRPYNDYLVNENPFLYLSFHSVHSIPLSVRQIFLCDWHLREILWYLSCPDNK